VGRNEERSVVVLVKTVVCALPSVSSPHPVAGATTTVTRTARMARIGLVIGMPMRALCTCSVSCSDSLAPQLVDTPGHGFKMVRIHASMVAAQMIYLKPVWNWSAQCFVDCSVRPCPFSWRAGDTVDSVTVWVILPYPQPTAGHWLGHILLQERNTRRAKMVTFLNHLFYPSNPLRSFLA